MHRSIYMLVYTILSIKNTIDIRIRTSEFNDSLVFIIGRVIEYSQLLFQGRSNLQSSIYLHILCSKEDLGPQLQSVGLHTFCTESRYLNSIATREQLEVVWYPKRGWEE